MPLQIYQKHNQQYKNQRFFIWRDPNDGYYTIIPMHTILRSDDRIDMSSAMCIGAEYFNGGVNTKINQRNLSFNDSCKWAIDAVGKDKNGNMQYEFTLKSTGLKLSLIDDGNRKFASREDKDKCNMFFKEGFRHKSAYQRFKLKEDQEFSSNNDVIKNISSKIRELRDGKCKWPAKIIWSGAHNIISNVEANRVVDVWNLERVDNALFQLYYKNRNYIHNGCQIGSEYGSRNQQFYFWRDPNDGYYTIIPMHTILRSGGKIDMSSAMCICVKDAKKGPGTQVTQCKLSFDDNCKWAIDDIGNGSFELTLKSNGLKLNVDGNEIHSHLELNTGVNAQDPQFGHKVRSQRFNFGRCNIFLFKNFGKIPFSRNSLEDIDHYLEFKAMASVEFKETCKKITKKNMSLYENAEFIYIPSSVEEVDDDAFSNHHITKAICDPKWLCKFKKDNLNLIAVKLSTETGNFNITKKDFEGCSNLQYLRLYCDKFKEAEADDLFKKLQVEEGALDKFTGIKSFSVYSKEDNKNIDLTFHPKFAYYFNLDTYLEIEVPDGIQKIRADRFKNKKWLIKLSLPNSVKEIEEGAFEGCENLREINIPEGITKIPARAFKDCKQICKLTLSNSKKDEIKNEIIEDAAEDETNSRELKLPNSIKEIGESAFEGCENLQEITLPEGIIKIPVRAFKDCENLSTVHLHDNIEEIEDEAFEGCVLLHSDLPCFSEKQKQLFKKFDKEVTVPSDFNLKGEELEKFKEKFCNAETIIMPNYAEYNSERYTELFNKIKIDKNKKIKAKVITCTPDVLKELADKANFESIFISEGTKWIDEESFKHCKNVQIVGIPTSVDKIDKGTFDNCNNIDTVICPLRLLEKFNRVKLADIRINEKEGTNLENFSGCKNLKSLKVPDNWIEKTEITDYIFSQCSNLDKIQSVSGNEIKKPEEIKSIQSSKKCEITNNVKEISTKEVIDKYDDQVTTLIIPQTIESIEDSAFENFSKLKTVKADPKWLKKLPKYNIEKFIVPAWVSTVNEKDFENCYNLKQLIFESPETKLCGEHGYKCDAFNNIKQITCSLQTAATMSEETKNKLKQLILIPGKKEISNENLSEFYSLELLYLPNTVESIATDAFKNNKNIYQVYCTCSLLKYLPKDQIRFLVLIDGKKDKLPENELKEFKNLKEVYDRNFELLWAKEDLNGQDNEIQGDRYDPENQEEEEDVQQPANQTNTQPFSGVQQPVNQTNTQKLNINPTTTMNDLVKADPSNKKYAEYVNRIKRAIDSNEDALISKDTSLQGISNSIIHVCLKIKNAHGRVPYTVQILTVLRLADEILNGKGAVSQVKTGEGKSFIIAILAIVLELNGRKIDVITSTTELAQRDEEEQRIYYDLFSKELSGVFYSKQGDEGRCGKNTKFDGSGYNTEVLKRAIVYSTLHNFESAYLHGLFSKDGVRKKRPYDVAIVDEVDNMLLDKTSSPTMLSHGIKVLRHKDILTIVYLLQRECDSKILLILKDIFPKFHIDIETVRYMKKAAQEAYEKKEEKRYFVRGKEAVVMDFFTGAIHQNARWTHGIHEMLEVRHKLPIRSRSALFCTVDHHILLKMYKRLTGLTGTIGKVEERKYINNMYGINIFEVLRNKPQRKTITKLKRPKNQDKLKIQAYNDIKEKIDKGRPVLVIVNHIYEAEGFSKYLQTNGIKNVGTVKGLDAKKDEYNISIAGCGGRVTVATIIGGRGTDIKISPEIEQIGGLHVIVVSQMANQRVLEQAIGRSGRNGQKGSATIFEPSMFKTQVAGFDPLYENLDNLQKDFAKHIKETWTWFYDQETQQLIEAYPFNLDVDDVLKISKKAMKNNSSSGKKRGAIMTAWGLCFKRISENEGYYRNWNNCQAAYNNFIEKIDKWVASVDNIDWGDLAIKGLIIGGTMAVSVAMPAIAVKLGVSAIVGAAAAGAIIGSLAELHAQISRGEEINWKSVLIRTFGGALKGAALTVPGASVPARVLSYASIAGTENYCDSCSKGDSSFEALGKSYANGAVESVFANAPSGFGRISGGKQLSNKTYTSGGKPISDAELANVLGGAKNPNWKPSGVSVGNSTKLGNNIMKSMNLPKNTKWPGYQAQHIIPSEFADHPVLKKIGFDLNEASNGIFLRVPNSDVSAMSRHKGYHSLYSNFVKEKLNLIDLNSSIEVIKNQVTNLQTKLRYLQEKGLPLYESQGANIDLWRRMFDNIK